VMVRVRVYRLLFVFLSLIIRQSFLSASIYDFLWNESKFIGGDNCCLLPFYSAWAYNV